MLRFCRGPIIPRKTGSEALPLQVLFRCAMLVKKGKRPFR